MEASRAIVARAGVAEGLEHGRSACLLSESDTPSQLGKSLGQLLARQHDARQLGQAARQILETRHSWPDIAKRTLALAERAIAAASSPKRPARLPTPRGRGNPADRPGAAN